MTRGLLAVAACALVLAGCSSHQAPSRPGPTADQWAGQVCGALAPWRTEVGQLNATTAAQMSTATTPAQAQQTLVTLLAGAQDASEKARAAVAAAGTPDVDGGAAVAASFVAALAGARDAYGRAHDDLAALPTTDSGPFYDGVAAVLARLNDEYARSAVDPSTLDSPELRRAFDGNASCR